MDTVFDVFGEQEYTFLKIKRGTVAGDIIESATVARGVFKLRNGMNVTDTQETKSSDATLHIRPDESFVSGGLVGHGIRYHGSDYQIIGVTEGRNFDDGFVEHYRLTLQSTDFSSYEVSS